MKIKNLAKIFFTNIVVLIFLVILIELGSFVGRSILKKKPLGFIYSNNLTQFGNPNAEFIAHPFYGFSHSNNKDIKIRGGYIEGPFVFYDNYDKNLPTILILGGSTSDGVFQHFSNGFTWPYYLNEKLKEKKIKFNIVNGATGGYNTDKELLKFLIDGKKLENLKLVISLNGINEIESKNYRPITSDEISKRMPYYSDTNFNIHYYEKYIDIRNYWFYNLFPNIKSLISFLGYKKSKVKLDLNNDFLNSVYLPSSIKSNTIDKWKFNMNMSKSMSTILNVKYYSFLQPTMGLDGCQIPKALDSKDYKVYEDEMNQEYFKEINELYESLKSECSKMEYCFDISCEAPPTGNNYTDIRHHNENGNLLISEKVFQIIKPNLY